MPMRSSQAVRDRSARYALLPSRVSKTIKTMSAGCVELLPHSGKQLLPADHLSLAS